MSHSELLDEDLGAERKALLVTTSRLVVYGFLVLWATQSPGVAGFLKGIVLADFLTWLFRAFAEVVEHPFRICVDFVALVFVMQLVLNGNLVALSGDMETKAMSYLGFLAALLLKGVGLAARLRMANDPFE